MTSPVFLSIVIPAWNEAEGIARAVAQALAVGDEVIVVDGGSEDQTAALAEQAGAVVLSAPKNRGAQLHAGALSATGNVFLFLHADAQLPTGARRCLEAALADHQIAGGNFRLKFSPPERWSCRFFSLANHLRRRWFHVYYGDSGIFVRRSVYEQLGGFRDYAIFEDYDFTQRLERCAKTAYLCDVPLTVSGRRFVGRPLQVLLLWGYLHLRWSLGAHPSDLARRYRDVRRAATITSL